MSKHNNCGCGCGHSHHDHHDHCGCGGHDSPDLKQELVRLGIAALLLGCAAATEHMLSLPMWGILLLYLPSYLAAGYRVLLDSARSVVSGELFSETLLMCIATLGALCLGFIPGGKPKFAEAVLVMIFFCVGQLFESIATSKSRRAVAALTDIRPDHANLERDGQLLDVHPDRVSVGDVIVVRPGERIPLDGVVTDGCSALDTAALTGESLPLDVSVGDSVCSGCVSLSGLLRLRVTKPFGQSTATKILELVEHSSANKARSESFIRRFAKWYTPAVVSVALLLALLPPALMGDFRGLFATWLLRGLTFLVVSCPCALVISVPLTFFGGIGGASRRGILVKGGNYMEALARVDTLVLDKTGTLTEGRFALSGAFPNGVTSAQLIQLAALAELHSGHPIATSIKNACTLPLTAAEIGPVRETAGLGVVTSVDGRSVAVGNSRLMSELGIGCADPDVHGGKTVIHVAADREYLGYLVISDAIRPCAEDALRALEAIGISRIVMLTGDRDQTARQVAKDLAISEYRAQLLPHQKVEETEKLLSERRRSSRLAFVGDGINDAPVLARADVGIAMGAMGSDAAVEAADVVLTDDDLTKLARAIAIARRTVAIARQNIVLAIGIKLAVLVLAALGYTPMWLAIFADVGVMVVAVLNAMRTLGA